MPLFKRLSVEFTNEDERGRLQQLVHEGYAQINVLETKKGVIRGGHFHKKCSEAFFVLSGEVKVTFEKEGMVEEVIFGPLDFFGIEPFVVHTMDFIKDCTMVQMYDRPVIQEDGSKDIFT